MHNDPWDFAARHPSPDGRCAARYVDLHETGHGAGPLLGRLTIEGMTADFGDRWFGGPPLWSSDSRYLAIPEWIEHETPDGGFQPAGQAVTIIDVARLREATITTDGAVIILRQVSQDAAVAIVDPRGSAVAREIPWTALSWEELARRRLPMRRPCTRLVKCAFWLKYLTAMFALALVAIPFLVWRGISNLFGSVVSHEPRDTKR
jgi:hypothetical protein